MDNKLRLSAGAYAGAVPALYGLQCNEFRHTIKLPSLAIHGSQEIYGVGIMALQV